MRWYITKQYRRNKYHRRSNYRYHNKKFKEEAEKRGLIISQGKYIGWSKTEPGEAFKNVLKEHGIKKPIDINRDGIIDMTVLPGNGSGSGETDKNKMSFMRKQLSCNKRYQCNVHGLQ